MKAEITQEVMKSSPPIAVTGWAFMNGLTLNEIVALATLLYIGLQTAYLLWKWYREFSGKRRARRKDD